jgi:hypothetical protein
MRFSRGGLVTRVAGFASDWGWAFVPPLVTLLLALLSFVVGPGFFFVLAFAGFVGLLFFAVVMLIS